MKERERREPLDLIEYDHFDIMSSCYIVRTRTSGGTGFGFKYKNVVYLITAKHVMVEQNKRKKKTIYIANDEGFTDFEGEIFYHDHEDCDLCVIKMPASFALPSSILYKERTPYVGHPISFYGFPGSVSTGVSFEHKKTKKNILMPIFRRGYLAGMFSEHDVSRLIIDATSIPGFSGSPVLAYDRKGNSFIIGVMVASNYRFTPIIDKEGDQSEFLSESNTGFSQAVHIEYALEIIKEKILV